MALRDEIRALVRGKDDLRSEKHVVAEWNGVELVLREIGGERRRKFEEYLEGKGEMASIDRMAAVIALSAEDSSGQLIWATESPDGSIDLEDAVIDELAAKRPAILKRLYDRTISLSKVDEEAVEEAAGESSAGPS